MAKLTFSKLPLKYRIIANTLNGEVKFKKWGEL